MRQSSGKLRERAGTPKGFERFLQWAFPAVLLVVGLVLYFLSAGAIAWVLVVPPCIVYPAYFLLSNPRFRRLDAGKTREGYYLRLEANGPSCPYLTEADELEAARKQVEAVSEPELPYETLLDKKSPEAIDERSRDQTDCSDPVAEASREGGAGR